MEGLAGVVYYRIIVAFRCYVKRAFAFAGQLTPVLVPLYIFVIPSLYHSRNRTKGAHLHQGKRIRLAAEGNKLLLLVVKVLAIIVFKQVQTIVSGKPNTIFADRLCIRYSVYAN